jgi:hypothetical protein
LRNGRRVVRQLFTTLTLIGCGACRRNFILSRKLREKPGVTRVVIAFAAIILSATAHAQDYDLSLSSATAAVTDGGIRITTFLRAPGPLADEAGNNDKALLRTFAFYGQRAARYLRGSVFQ